ncbi:MAG: hypothetical protein AAGA54_13470 [Myxococcota bacterium]
MDDERYSNEQAAAALGRAAQLQLEAAERAEHCTETAVARREGYGRTELVAAAAEVGIDERFVELALREEAAAAGRTQTPDAVLMRWLGTRRQSLSVSRVFDADGATTLEAVLRVFASDTVGLELRGSVDATHPLQGGVLEFHMPRLGQFVSTHGRYTTLAYRLEQLEMWTLRVTMRTVGARTEVVVQGDLRPGALANVKVARVGGVLGAGLGGAGGAAAAVGMGIGALAALPAVAAGALGTAGMAFAYRALYRSVLRKTEAALDDLLGKVSGDLTRAALLAPTET